MCVVACLEKFELGKTMLYLKYRACEFKHILLIGAVYYVFLVTKLTQSILDVKNPRCVFEMGKNLTTRLTNQPWGTKEDLINDLTDYYIYLNTAYRVEDESHPNGKRALQKLKARGGPPFLNVTVQDSLLEEKYEMGAVEIDHIKDVIADIVRLWKDVEKGVLVPPEFENY